LPLILEDLGNAFGDFLVGAVGFFGPVSSWAGLLAQYIADAAASFSEWANSVGGENAIRTFMDQASASAQALWGFIVAVGVALFDLFTQTAGTGDGLLNTLTGIVNKFTEWENSDEGRAKIATWMQFATELATALGESVKIVGGTLLALDSPENRAALLDVIGLLNSCLIVLGNLAIVGANAFTSTLNGALALIAVLEELWQWEGKVVAQLSFAVGVISKFAESFSSIDKLTESVKKLVDWLGKIKIPNMGTLGGLLSGLGKGLGFTATGGVFNGAQARVIGEAGPEAVVPLDRPLSQVDPAVRWMSALAQGKASGSGASGLAANSHSLYIADGAVRIVTPTRDAAQVASMLLDGLVAASQ
jgi:hypothetical protein